MLIPFSFLCFILISFTSKIEAADPINCPYNFTAINNNRCVQVVPYLANYSISANRCNSLFKGRLVSIPNAIDNNAITTLISSSEKPVWIGLKCNESQIASSCRWDDNSGRANYNNFLNGYPIVEIGNCVFMMSSGSSRGKWISGDCDNGEYYSLCEVDPISPNVDDFCAFNHDGQCYRPFFSPLSEPDAQEACEQECANLVSIHSSRENNFVRSLWDSKNESSAAYFRIGALIVFSDSYFWTDRTPWDYNNFGYSNSNLGSCASMSLVDDVVGAGKWITSSCDTPLPFVCKRSATVHCGATPAPSIQQCNGTQFLYNSGTFTSPNWPNSYYGATTPCSFVLTTPTGTITQVQFPIHDLNNGSTISLYNHIEDSEPFKVIDSNTYYYGTGYWYKSTSNSMRVVFRPSISAQSNEVFRWQAEFQSAGGPSGGTTRDNYYQTTTPYPWWGRTTSFTVSPWNQGATTASPWHQGGTTAWYSPFMKNSYRRSSP